MDKFIDLHMHSTRSDGSFAPKDVVAHALSVGVSTISLTDHDSVAGVAEATAAGDAVGIGEGQDILAGLIAATDGDCGRGDIGVVNVGDEVKVKLIGIDDRGKVKLSLKSVDQATGEDISGK